MKHSKGFSLIELLIALSVAGIIVAVAYPSYIQHVIKVRRSDGIVKLMEVMQMQEEYFVANDVYSENFTNLGFINDFVLTSDKGNYFILYYPRPGPCPVSNCMALLASPVNPKQQRDGFLYLHSNGTQLRYANGSWNSGWD